MGLPAFVPLNNIMFQIQVEQEPQVSWFKSFFCRHKQRLNFRIIDYRGGPGWMSDIHEGSCCRDCGLILSSVKVY